MYVGMGACPHHILGLSLEFLNVVHIKFEAQLDLSSVSSYTAMDICLRMVTK